MKLQGQVAIVTGGGRNIGEQIAKLFAAEGARIAIVDMDKGRGERVAGEITQAGGDAAAFVANVASSREVADTVKAVVERFGRIDILVNNVAISDNKHILDITEEEWDRVIAVTLKAPFLMAKQVAQQMIAQNSGGKIVNMGSTSGFRGRGRAIAYSAAKGGVANLTRAMAVQLAPHNIRVNIINPVAGETAMLADFMGQDTPEMRAKFIATIPLGRLSLPTDIATAAVFFASDEAAFITGACLEVDGGRCV